MLRNRTPASASEVGRATTPEAHRVALSSEETAVPDTRDWSKMKFCGNPRKSARAKYTIALKIGHAVAI